MREHEAEAEAEGGEHLVGREGVGRRFAISVAVFRRVLEKPSLEMMSTAEISYVNQISPAGGLGQELNVCRRGLKSTDISASLCGETLLSHGVQCCGRQRVTDPYPPLLSSMFTVSSPAVLAPLSFLSANPIYDRRRRAAVVSHPPTVSSTPPRAAGSLRPLRALASSPSLTPCQRSPLATLSGR